MQNLIPPVALRICDPMPLLWLSGSNLTIWNFSQRNGKKLALIARARSGQDNREKIQRQGSLLIQKGAL